MKKLTLSLGIGLLLVGLNFNPCQADEVYTFVVKKQEEKAKTRWTLSDWLETRDKMRLMDLWLAIHSPSPYEFYIGGDYSLNQSKNNYLGYYGAAYASIFGLEAKRGASPKSEWLGLFHLRIFGFHAQGTNITLQAGLRSLDSPISARNGLFGVGSSIYINRYFGVDGLYRHYFDSAPSVSGLKYSGNRLQGGAFIDFKFLRVYANYYSEPSTVDAGNGNVTQESDQGAQFGLRFYF